VQHGKESSEHGLTSADDTTLVLEVLASALLCDLLCDALPVHAAEDDGPGDLARVFVLVRRRLALGSAGPEDLQRVAGESEEEDRVEMTNLSIAADEELARWGGYHDEHRSNMAGTQRVERCANKSK